MPGAMQREGWEESRKPLLGVLNHLEPLSIQAVYVYNYTCIYANVLKLCVS